jgi:hypothetical protein
MCPLPPAWRNGIVRVAPVFSQRGWRPAPVLVRGAILAPGQRTVTAALRVLGCQAAPHCHAYPRVRNRAVWARVVGSRLWQGVLGTTGAPTGALVMGWEDPMERRRRERLTVTGLERAPVRASHDHWVKARGLRWLRVRVLVLIPGAGRLWALPCLTGLCPAERSHQGQGRPHGPLLARARQMRLFGKRWRPPRAIGGVVERRYAAVEVRQAVREAALAAPAAVRPPGQWGRPRKQGPRLPTLHPGVEAPKTAWQPVHIAH